MRQLASIQTIDELRSIENADSIEVARVLGWNVVVKKGEFRVGERCVYCEIDSILPQRPEFEFLADRKYRIKTIKLRGQVSQGICFPLSILPDCSIPSELRVIGEDVTDILEITKYEPPEPEMERARLRGFARGSFPHHIPQTDETRIQSKPKVLERNAGKTFTITEKIDGTSMTVFYDVDTGLHVCSRKVDLAPDFIHKHNGTAYWDYVMDHGVGEIIRQLGNVAIQGELFGPGIGGSGTKVNKYDQKNLQWRVFNIYDIDNHKYFDQQVLMDAVEAFGLGDDFLVPYLGKVVMNSTVDELIESAKGKSLINKNVPREGIVMRSMPEDIDYELGRLSFKVINPDFLLKFE